MAQFSLNLALNLNDFKARLGDVQAGLSLLATAAEEPLRKIQEIGQSILARLHEASQAALGDELADVRFARVFGEANDAAASFAENIANSFDRANGDIKQFMAQAKFTADGLGFTKDKSVELSQAITKLAIDFADFAQVSDADALGAMQQALMGNTRGLKQFGIALDDTDVKVRALAQGLNPDSLTQQQTALITLAILTERMGVASGAAAERQNTFAGALRALQTQWDELNGDLGRSVNSFAQPFVEGATNAVKAIREWIAEYPNLAAAATQAATALGAVATGLGGAVGAVAAGIRNVQTLAVAWKEVGGVAGLVSGALNLLSGTVSMAAGGVTLLVTSTGGLLAIAAAAGAAIGSLANYFFGFSDAAGKAATAAGKAQEKLALDAGFGRAKDAAFEAGSAYDALAKNTQKLKEVTDSDSESRKRYNDLLALTGNEFRSLLATSNKMSELNILRENEGRLNPEQKKRLIELTQWEQEELRKQAAAEKGATAATLDNAQALAKREDALKRTKSAQEESRKAEEALEDARVKSTDSLQDDVALLEKRTQAEMNRAQSNAERAAIAQRGAAQRMALEEERERELKNAAKSAQDEARNAEDALLQARAAATKSIADDLALLRDRAAREIALGKTVEAQAALKRKWLAEERRLIEDNARAQKKTLDDFLNAQDAALQRRNGQGTQADINALSRTWKEQAGNITTAADLERFKAGLAHAFDEPLKASRDAVAELNRANPLGNAETSAKALQLAADEELARKSSSEILRAAADALKVYSQPATALQSGAKAAVPGVQPVTEIKGALPAEMPAVQETSSLTNALSQLVTALRDLSTDAKAFLQRMGQGVLSGLSPAGDTSKSVAIATAALKSGADKAGSVLSSQQNAEKNLANMGQLLLDNLNAIQEASRRQNIFIHGLTGSLQKIRAADAATTDLSTSGVL